MLGAANCPWPFQRGEALPWSAVANFAESMNSNQSLAGSRRLAILRKAAFRRKRWNNLQTRAPFVFGSVTRGLTLWP
jgi:hypothetical protein